MLFYRILRKAWQGRNFFMRKISKFLLYTALAVILCVYGFFGVFAWQTANIPENLRIEPGSSKELILPAGVEVSSSGDSILNIEGAYPLSLKANEEGISRLSLKLFGVELKKVSVTVGETRKSKVQLHHFSIASVSGSFSSYDE